MDDNKTIIGLLLIIAILGAALFIRIIFFQDSNVTQININSDTNIQQDMPGLSGDATNAIANKTSGYVKSVQQEKDNHNQLEQSWDEYSK